MPAEEDTFALIVGGGPVGLTLALDLGLRGVPAILVNDNLVTTQSPKCSYITIRAMEYFRRLGIAHEIRGPRPRRTSGLRVTYRTQLRGHELGSADLTLARQERAASPEDPQPYLQHLLEPLLRRHAEQQASVELRFGWKATGIYADDEGAGAIITQVATGNQRRVRARYLVGCDGPRSTVRTFIGAKLVGKDGAVERKFLSGTKMIYYIRSKDLQSIIRVPPATLLWVINRDVRGLIVAHDEGDRFIIQYQIPHEVSWQDIRPREILDRLFGPGVEYEILFGDYWEGGVAKVADTYGSKTVFLAGDAAHLFTPLGGFGMNTGIGDAINLGWKLAAVHNGWAGDGLLDSYAAERQEIGIRNSLVGVHAADRKDRWVVPDNIESDTPEAEVARREFGRFIVTDDREEHYTQGLQLGERYASSIIIEPSDVADADPWDRYTPNDDAGARLPHFTLDDGSSLYDVLGSGFSLIIFGEIDATRFESLAADRKLPLSIVRFQKRDPQFLRDLILVRPDLHIAWSADELPVDLLAIIDGVRGAVN